MQGALPSFCGSEAVLAAAHCVCLRSIITFMEARWKVPSNPARGGAFYSPWFGIESSDNLNLIQVSSPQRSVSRAHVAALCVHSP